jgi:hypothetical protein
MSNKVTIERIRWWTKLPQASRPVIPTSDEDRAAAADLRPDGLRGGLLSRAGNVSDISDWLAIEGSRHRGRDHAPAQTIDPLTPVD